jgi:hypothetical protein
VNNVLKQYLPALGSVLVVVITVLAGALTDNRITMPELVVIVVALANAVMTYIVPRTTQWPWLKIAVTAVLAAVNALQGYLTDGLTANELLLVLVAGIGATGVVAATSKYAPLHEPVIAGVTLTPAAQLETHRTRTYGTDVKNERGAIDTNVIWVVVGVLLVVALVIWILGHV